MLKNSTLLICLFLLIQNSIFAQTAEMKAEMLLTEIICPAQVLTEKGNTFTLTAICEKHQLPIEGGEAIIVFQEAKREAGKAAKLVHTEIPVKITSSEMRSSSMIAYLTLTLSKESSALNNHLEIERGFYLKWEKDLLLEHEVIKDESGKIINDNYYSDGLPVGKSIVYSADDSITTISHSMLGQLHGVFELYDNDILYKRQNYFMGDLSGEEKWYYANGKVSYEGTYFKGLKEGPGKNYFEDGSLHTVGNFVNDTLEGEFLSYHENGKPKVKAHKHKGVYHGESYSYFENGKVHFMQVKVNGVNSGKYFRNYESGKLEVTANWLDDKLDGERIDYYENGKKKMQGNYKAGAQVGVWKYWDEKGVETTEDFE